MARYFKNDPFTYYTVILRRLYLLHFYYIFVKNGVFTTFFTTKKISIYYIFTTKIMHEISLFMNGKPLSKDGFPYIDRFKRFYTITCANWTFIIWISSTN